MIDRAENSHTTPITQHITKRFQTNNTCLTLYVVFVLKAGDQLSGKLSLIIFIIIYLHISGKKKLN